MFKKNDSSLEDHYKNIKIKKTHPPKGIFKYKPKLNETEYSMEYGILQLFLEYINSIPIAQNIIVMNKETSFEEMQAFFNRAILCNYNTLFVVQLNKSFSEYQQKKMNNLINQLLEYKKEQVIKIKPGEDYKNLQEYMESCIIFVYKIKIKIVNLY